MDTDLVNKLKMKTIKGPSRRQFLQMSSVGIGCCLVTDMASASQPIGSTTLPYSPTAIAQVSQLKDNRPVKFNFPDESSPCVLIKLGHPVPNGVGPQQDIVAFSTLCTHMGCPLTYDVETRVFKCHCHFAIFDAEMAGQMTCGQATEKLPQIVLDYNPNDDSIQAIAVKGLIYGRQANVL